MHYQTPEATALQHFEANGYLHLPVFFPETDAGKFEQDALVNTVFPQLASFLLSGEIITLNAGGLHVDAPGTITDRFQNVKSSLRIFACLAVDSDATESFEIVVGTHKPLPVLDVTKTEDESASWTVTRFDTKSLKSQKLFLRAGDILILAAGVFYRKLANDGRSIRQIMELNFAPPPVRRKKPD